MIRLAVLQGVGCLVLTFGIFAGLTACQHAAKEPAETEKLIKPAPRLVDALKNSPSECLLPEIKLRSGQEWAKTASGAELLKWAKEARNETCIPETTYTLYRIFKLKGERPQYQAPYYKKRELLAQEVLATWLENDDSRIDRINDLLWSICEETTWVVPAHEKNEWFIDLFSSETGANLGHVLMLVGDRLPEEVRNRVRQEVKRRILDPYLIHAHEYWWDKGGNNWTGVCAGSVGQAFLLMEDDPDRLAEGLTLVMGQLEHFITNGFEPDGGCLEGIGYWGYGLSQFIDFAEMLRVRTNGSFDLLAQDKIKAIAKYPLAVSLGENLYASFADAHQKCTVEPYIAARVAERTGENGLLSLAGGLQDWRLTTTLRNIVWWNGEKPVSPKLEDAFLPVSGIVRIIGGSGPGSIILAAKAGHNAEPHNHNDVGSFIVAVDGTVYLCDPGGGKYDAAYFSPKRYDNVFANSFGHSVPRFGGRLQSAGRQFCGTMEKTGDKSVSVRFEKAYDLPALKQALRIFKVNGDSLEMRDEFAFDGAPVETEEALLTWLDVETDGPVARVKSDKGTLEVRTESGVFAAERLEGACKANNANGMLTRLTVTYPPSGEIKTRFTMKFVPAT
jgi:hypothetical protein